MRLKDVDGPGTLLLAEDRIAMLAPYQVNRELFGSAVNSATDGVEHRRSMIFDWAENRVHSLRSLLLYLNE